MNNSISCLNNFKSYIVISIIFFFTLLSTITQIHAQEKIIKESKENKENNEIKDVQEYEYDNKIGNENEEKKEKLNLFQQNGLNQQILIEKNKYIKLPIFEKENNWQRISLPIPHFRPFKNTIEAAKISTNYTKNNLTAVAIEETNKEEKYYGRIKSGIGNYFSTYLDATFLNPNFGENKINYGLRGKHKGSINGPKFSDKSGFYYQSLEGFAEKSISNWSIHLNSILQRKKYNLYGIYSLPNKNVDNSTIEINQYYTWMTKGIFTLNRNAFKGKSIEIIPEIGYFSGKNNTKELTINTSFGTKFDIGKNLKLLMEGQYFLSLLSYETNQDLSRHFIRFNPKLEFPFHNLDVGIGLNINYINSDALFTLDDVGTNIMLNLLLKYPIFEYTNVELGIYGDSEPRTLNTKFTEMPYLSVETKPSLQKKLFVAYLGVHTYDIPNLFFHAKFEFKRARNYLSYVNKANKQEEFMPLFLPLGNIIQLKGNMRYKINASISFSALMSYYSYDFGKTPTHLPKYIIELSSDFDIYEKVYGRVGVNISTTRYYKNNLTQLLVLDDIVDVYTHFDYKLSEKINIFFQLNNLLNQEYQIYHLYPSKGFNFLIGGAYKI